MIFHIHSEYPILRHTRAALGSGCQPILDRACGTTSGTGAWAHGSQDRDMSSQDSLTPSLLVWESSFKIQQCFSSPVPIILLFTHLMWLAQTWRSISCKRMDFMIFGSQNGLSMALKNKAVMVWSRYQEVCHPAGGLQLWSWDALLCLLV